MITIALTVGSLILTTSSATTPLGGLDIPPMAPIDLDALGAEAATNVAQRAVEATPTTPTASTRERIRTGSGWLTVGLGVVTGALVGSGIGLSVEAGRIHGNIGPMTYSQLQAHEAYGHANDLASQSTAMLITGLATGGLAVISAAVFGSTWLVGSRDQCE